LDYIGTIRSEFDGMAQSVVATLPNLAIALVVLVATWLVARIGGNTANRIVSRSSLRISLQHLVRTLVKLGIWVVGLLVAAAIAIPGFTPAGVIAGLGFGAVAIGFAFQDIFENFLAGVLIMLREKMQIGDTIEADGILGKVEKITLRETHIRQFSGELTILPNSMIFKNPVKIYTDTPERRNEVVIGVSYDTDLAQAEKVIRRAVEAVPGLLEGKSVDIYAQEFGASSVDFLVRWWIDASEHDYLGVKAEVVFAIKRALDEAGIEIPFPYVTHTFKEPVPLPAKA
jgi:small-conductance mechanosensitive channel